ncbi:hypothetical protein I4U23_028974 [Adineta vaga]|nr:hypothetical protein I4U23_028974 [Adineta vaga]
MSSNTSSQLILNLDITLRNVLLQPTIDNIRSCFSLIQQCHYRRLQEETNIQDDSLYIPSILLLRQFSRFQDPSIFDELLQQFISLFQLIPISTKKVLDDLLCIISIILTKRIMTTNDEVQQDLFIRFFRAFCLSIKTNSTFFYREFLGNFNQNLPIIGHYISCLLQFYEKINSLDYRLNILDTLWSIIYVNKNENENEYRVIIGQIIACFLPGILKTLTQDIGSIHQRLVQINLTLLSYIIRISAVRSSKHSNPIKNELRDLVVERNDQWLAIVDAHIAPILQRLTKNYVNHGSVSVRRALAIFMLTILSFCSTWLKISSNIALKSMLVLVSSIKDDQNEIILKRLLEKLFQLPIESISDLPSLPLSSESSILTYENEFIFEIFNSSTIKLSDHLLIECQTDLFQLLDQQQDISTYTDRRWRLQLFIGYYTFIHRHIDFLFDMNTFTDKLLRFIFQTLDFDIILRSHLNLLNGSSLPSKDYENFHQADYDSVYKHLKSDVHDEIQQIMKVFITSHSKFTDYLFEQINRKKITDENNQKIFYLLSILFEKNKFENIEGYQLLLSLLTDLICDDNNQKHSKRRKKRSHSIVEVPVSVRNLTIYYLLQCLRTLTSPNQTEYLIDYIPLLLLCHSSIFTIIHQTSFVCLLSFSGHLPSFLVTQSEYIIDTSLRKLQTSSYDGYLILIEFIRLGNTQVINLPIMTHVIEQLLLELSCLPSIECIELTFQFLNVFCQQVIDIVGIRKTKYSTNSLPSKSLIDFALELQQQSKPTNTSTDETDEEKKEEKYPWHQMLVSIVDVFQHFISHSNVHVRSYVLDAFPSLAQLLSTIDENLFLPLVHKIWPGLIHRFFDFDVNIRIRCLTTIECLCELCSDFIDRRIRQDILPLLIQQLEKNRLLSSTNALEYRYTKYLLANIGTILNAITMDIDSIEKIVLILLQYLQVDQLASIVYEQLNILTKKYSDIIWLTVTLHDQNEFRQGYFDQMKVYKPEPMLTIDPKWKLNLLTC